MSITIDITPEKETRLQRQASLAGMPLGDYVAWLAEQSPLVGEDGRGVSRIVGTRIKVAQVAAEATRLGKTPEQIVEEHPHLTLAQIYAALAHYHANKGRIDAQIDASLADYDRARREHDEPPFAARMRAEGRLPHSDPTG